MPASRIAKSAAGRGGELLGDVLGEVAGEAGLAGPRRPAGDGPGDRGVEQADLGEVPGELLDLDQEAGGQARRGAPPTILTLTSAHWPLPRVADGIVAVLGRREQDPVVVGSGRRSWSRRCRRSSPYLSTPKSSTRRRISWAGLYEAGTSVQPAAGAGAAPGNGRLPGEPGRMVELQPERRREGRVVGRARCSWSPRRDPRRRCGSRRSGRSWTRRDRRPTRSARP